MLLHSVFSMEKCESFEEDCENINICKVHKNGSETDAYEKTNEMCEFEKEEENCRKSAKWTHKICRKSSKREQKGKNVKEKSGENDSHKRREQSADDVAGMTKTYKKAG